MASRQEWRHVIGPAGATIVVVTTWITYALLSAWWFGSPAHSVAPYVYAPLLVLAGGAAGRWLGEHVRLRVLALGLVVVTGWMLVAVLLTPVPGKLPIGYANANAAVAVQLVALCGLVALDRRARALALAALTLGMLTILANRSAAAVVVALPLVAVIALAVAATPGRRRWPQAALGVSVLVASAVALVSLARRAAWPSWALDALDGTRRSLWLQTWEAFRGDELTGRGPGGFAAINTMTDPDLGSAHSLPLQVAVELGAPGLALLLALFLCGLVTALSAATPARAWIATTGWVALALHSFVDHLLEYWPVPLAAGLVIGFALVAQPGPQLRDQPVELPGAVPSRP